MAVTVGVGLGLAAAQAAILGLVALLTLEAGLALGRQAAKVVSPGVVGITPLLAVAKGAVVAVDVAQADVAIGVAVRIGIGISVCGRAGGVSVTVLVITVDLAVGVVVDPVVAFARFVAFDLGIWTLVVATDDKGEDGGQQDDAAPPRALERVRGHFSREGLCAPQAEPMGPCYRNSVTQKTGQFFNITEKSGICERS